MNGLVSVPPAPHSPAGSMVEADGWFPSIDVNQMRDTMRLRGDVPHARLIEAIRGGILTVMAQTNDWSDGWRKNGASSLAEVKPDKMLGDQHLLTMLYTRAVRFYAAAEIADLARDSSATREEVDRIEEESLIAPDLRAHALAAVRDMLGVTRVAVELI